MSSVTHWDKIQIYPKGDGTNAVSHDDSRWLDGTKQMVQPDFSTTEAMSTCSPKHKSSASLSRLKIQQSEKKYKYLHVNVHRSL